MLKSSKVVIYPAHNVKMSIGVDISTYPAYKCYNVGILTFMNSIEVMLN